MMGRTPTNGWTLVVGGGVVIALWVANQLTGGGVLPRANQGYWAVAAGIAMILWGAGAIVTRRTGQDWFERTASIVAIVGMIAFLFWRAFSALG